MKRPACFVNTYKVVARRMREKNMKYCTNCGKESRKGICENCGVKNNKVHLFCGWCGEQLNANANICPNCKTKIKPGALSKIYKIIALLLVPFALVLLVLGANSRTKFNGICFIVSTILLLPFVGNFIYSITNKKSTRIILSTTRILLVLFLVLVIPYSTYTPPEPESVQDRAYDEALEVFHQNVRLKNESSFQLNSYQSQVVEEYNENENQTLYKITINYSAQNGFGGNGTDSYTVELIYDENTDEFTTLRGYE